MMEQTDEEHYITMPEIKEELARIRSHSGPEKCVCMTYEDLRSLGIEVEGEPVGNRYHYHVVEPPV